MAIENFRSFIWIEWSEEGKIGMTQNCILRITVNKPNIFFFRQDYQYLGIDLKLQTINLITFYKNEGEKTIRSTRKENTNECDQIK